MLLLEALTRDFGTLRALDHVDLGVRRGEVLGLLGHNGAGKTTTIRLVAGLLTPTEGRVRVDGLDPVVDGPTVRRRLGVLPANAAVDDRLTGRQNLRFTAELFDLPRADLEVHLDRLLARLQLADRADEPAGTYSTGMRQRLSLARVLLHDPEVLLLDEPTASLDPVAARMVRDMIAELAEGPSGGRARTVVLSTHDLDEAQRLCHRVAILEHGCVRALGTPAELAGSWGNDVVVEVHTDDLAAAMVLEPVAGVVAQAENGRHLRFPGVARAEVPRIVHDLSAAGVRIYGVDVRGPSLEDVYLRLHADTTATTEVDR